MPGSSTLIPDGKRFGMGLAGNVSPIQSVYADPVIDPAFVAFNKDAYPDWYDFPPPIPEDWNEQPKDENKEPIESQVKRVSEFIPFIALALVVALALR